MEQEKDEGNLDKDNSKDLLHKTYLSYTKEASELSKEVSVAIEPIFKKYFEDGYNPVEIQKIMEDEIGLIYSETVLRHSYNLRKHSKKPTPK